jgi:hypothetical protein
VRKDFWQTFASGASAGHGSNLGFGVPVENTGELRSGIARDVDYPYLQLSPLA